MLEMNRVMVAGNLTRDPEVREVGEGQTVGVLNLAMNRRLGGGGEEAVREETTFVDVEVWNRQAEACERYLRKGSPVFVEGRLHTDRWEDRQTGAARSRLLVRAGRVHFLAGPASTEETEKASRPAGRQRGRTNGRPQRGRLSTRSAPAA